MVSRTVDSASRQRPRDIVGFMLHECDETTVQHLEGLIGLPEINVKEGIGSGTIGECRENLLPGVKEGLVIEFDKKVRR